MQAFRKAVCAMNRYVKHKLIINIVPRKHEFPDKQYRMMQINNRKLNRSGGSTIK